MTTTDRRTAAVLLLTAGTLTLAACSGPSARATRGSVVLDGSVAEWSETAVASADEAFVYLRFALEGDQTTLQNNIETTRIAIDTDNNPDTGARLNGPAEIGAMGIDLEILLTPPLSALPADRASRIRERASGEPPALTPGVVARRYDAGGTPRTIGHADIDFAIAPTHANDWTEARFGRLSSALLGSGIDAAGTARGMVFIDDDQGNIVAYADPFTVDLPAPAPDLGLTSAVVPVQQPGTIRVLSLNVNRATPARQPEPFARLITALAPDIILFQEFNGVDTETLAEWLGEYVGPLEGKNDSAVITLPDGSVVPGNPGAWEAAADADAGVAIATPHRVHTAFNSPVTLEGPEGDDRTARAIAALVSTPLGDALATSVHLKCCGSAGSREDLIRAAEADAINAFAKDAAQQAGAITGTWPALRILGGDVNLVGTRPPVDALTRGLDADGSDMTIADPAVLGDRAFYTWSDPASSFSPGRLDWVLYSDASARLDRAFVLDLGRLTRGAVEAAGLEPSDTAATDHLPVVMDLRPIN
jgi:endonuclease/exonuclease/phosphatase family metal-dependent hydrolase